MHSGIFEHNVTCVLSVKDLRIGQIGHSLGPRATPSYGDSTLTENLRN